MIILGILLTVWGVLLLALARPLHTQWGRMIRELKAAGFQKPPFGTRFVASERGLQTFRILGAAGLVAGVALVVAGLLKGAR